jgi:hypothetical protein
MNEHSNTSDDSEAAQQAFIASNAEYFAQALAPLNDIFHNSGMMNIVSEESDFTIVVGIKPTEEDGVMDVDCASLDPNQESLKDCINALFI